MKRFVLERTYDTAISRIAQGVQFSDGIVSLHFIGRVRSTAVYPTIQDVLSVHGGDDTELVWIDDDD